MSATAHTAMYISIKDLSKELGLASHVLRFWETKFKCIKPIKRNGGCRYYRPVDIEYIKRIKYLLYEEKYTIQGAIAQLREEGSPVKVNKPEAKIEITTDLAAADASDASPATSCTEKPLLEKSDSSDEPDVSSFDSDVSTITVTAKKGKFSSEQLGKLKAIRDKLQLAIDDF